MKQGFDLRDWPVLRRRVSAHLAAAAAASLMLACGGGGGDAAAPTLNLSASATTALQGQTLTLSWSAPNASYCDASGGWVGRFAASGATQVTPAVAGTQTYALNCVGRGGSASSSVTIAATAATNAIPVVVNAGPTGNSLNTPFVTLTICEPGTATCRTIDNVLVDTGSYGLRLLQSAVGNAVNLPEVTSGLGNPLGACAQFVSGYQWGPVRRADVRIGSLSSGNIPIQIVSDATFSSVPNGCTNTGLDDVGSLATLGANGILGVGLFRQDCGIGCTIDPNNGVYYSCAPSGSCTPTTVPLANQVANPIAGFSVHNQGVKLALPPVGSGGATSVTGVMVFGIGTAANNGLSGTRVYLADPDYGEFSVTYKGTTFNGSFIDSGSNGYVFPDLSIPTCGAADFFCPSNAPLTLSILTSAYNGSSSGSTTIYLDNPAVIPFTQRATSLGFSSVDLLTPDQFDLGLPFFFGRQVFVALEGAVTGGGTGPYWAF